MVHLGPEQDSSGVYVHAYMLVCTQVCLCWCIHPHVHAGVYIWEQL